MPDQDPTRSYEPITVPDLKRLAQIARIEREAFFARGPQCAALASRLVCTALCQGAARHFVDGITGVKDFDIWYFYASLPDVEFPPRWRIERDFSDPKFGKSSDRPEFVGRRVDLLGRSLPAEPGIDPLEMLRQYLSEAKTDSARFLAQKAVVLLEPDSWLGTVAWPKA